jgi:hypothetical protein
MECGDSRASFKRRMDLRINLTCVGFNGRVLVDLEKLFFERKKFNVVEICRKSDVDSQFNGRALQSVSDCEPGKQNTTVVCFVVILHLGAHRIRCIS